MDYDSTSMPAAYEAGRAYAPEVLEFWLRTISSAIAEDHIGHILDLGCGTGRYSAALATHFGARVIGIDPSGKMLSEARKKRGGRVWFVRGSAEAIPLADAVVDMVFISMALHHFASTGRSLRECRRVLRQSGALCLRAATSDRTDEYPYVPFFPSTRSLLNRDLPGVACIQKTFAEAGFRQIDHQVVRSKTAATWSAYAEKISHRADSFLTRLDNEAFTGGLAALRDHARTVPDAGPVIEPVDFFAFRRC